MRRAHIQKGSSQESHRVGLAEMRGGACATFGGGGRGCTNSGQGFAWGRAGRHPAWGTGDDGKGEGEENRTGQGGKAVAKSLGFTGGREVHGEGPGGKQSPCQITKWGEFNTGKYLPSWRRAWKDKQETEDSDEWIRKLAPFPRLEVPPTTWWQQGPQWVVPGGSWEEAAAAAWLDLKPHSLCSPSRRQSPKQRKKSKNTRLLPSSYLPNAKPVAPVGWTWLEADWPWRLKCILQEAAPRDMSRAGEGPGGGKDTPDRVGETGSNRGTEPQPLGDDAPRTQTGAC